MAQMSYLAHLAHLAKIKTCVGKAGERSITHASFAGPGGTPPSWRQCRLEAGVPQIRTINGYELKEDGVRYLTVSDEPIPYFGMDQTVLLSNVRKALTEAEQPRSEKKN
jgi:hypothetical protein